MTSSKNISWRGFGMVVNGELFTCSDLAYLDTLGSGTDKTFVVVNASLTPMTKKSVKKELKASKVRSRYRPVTVVR